MTTLIMDDAKMEKFNFISFFIYENQLCYLAITNKVFILCRDMIVSL